MSTLFIYEMCIKCVALEINPGLPLFTHLLIVYRLSKAMRINRHRTRLKVIKLDRYNFIDQEDKSIKTIKYQGNSPLKGESVNTRTYRWLRVKVV